VCSSLTGIIPTTLASLPKLLRGLIGDGCTGPFSTGSLLIIIHTSFRRDERPACLCLNQHQLPPKQPELAFITPLKLWTSPDNTLIDQLVRYLLITEQASFSLPRKTKLFPSSIDIQSLIVKLLMLSHSLSTTIIEKMSIASQVSPRIPRRVDNSRSFRKQQDSTRHTS
jgi:hypothetical protein